MTIAIMSFADCREAIASIKGRAATLQSDIHNVAVSTLAHIRDHGDWTLAACLLNALPSGQRVKSLAHWYGHFSNGCAKFAKVNDEWTCNLSKERSDDDFDIEAAMATTFAELTEEKDPRTLDMKAFLKMLSNRANDTDYHKGTQIRKVDPAVNAMAAEILAFVRAKQAA